MSERILTNSTEVIEVTILDDSAMPLTGSADILISIRRISDNFYLDFNNMIFTSSGWTSRQTPMTEISNINAAGEYQYIFNTSTIINEVNDDTYQIRVEQFPGTDAANVPQFGEIKVGQFIDDIPTILTDTNEIQDKLPINYIMGSSVTSSKDDELDKILTIVSGVEQMFTASENNLSVIHGSGSWEGISASEANISQMFTASENNLGILHGTGSWQGFGSAEEVADAVWDELKSEHTGSDSFGEGLISILGLVQSNFRMKDQIYDVNKRLTSAKIRIYNNAIDCGNDNNFIKEYSLNASYDGDGNLINYSVVEI